MAPHVSKAREGVCGLACHRRTIFTRLLACLALGLLIPEPESFVSAPGQQRLRGSRSHRQAEGQSKEESEAALRARIAELEKRMSQRVAEQEPAGSYNQDMYASEAELMLRDMYNKVVEELRPDLENVIDARFGKLGEKEYAWKMGDVRSDEDIVRYKRKYEAMGQAISIQEAYMKAFNKAVKSAKKSQAVKDLAEVWKNGKGSWSRKQIRAEADRIIAGDDGYAQLFFKDMLPEVMLDPVQDTLNGIASIVLFLVATLLCLLCLNPPIPSSGE